MTASFTHQEAATLAAGYLRYAAALRQDRADDASLVAASDEAAYETVQRLVNTGPAGSAWLAVLEALRQTPDEDLEVSAAGPLEDLVSVHGMALERELLAEAARSTLPLGTQLYLDRIRQRSRLRLRGSA